MKDVKQIYENYLDASFVHERIHFKAYLENDIKCPMEMCKYLRETGFKRNIIASRNHFAIPVVLVYRLEGHFQSCQELKTMYDHDTEQVSLLNALSILYPWNAI